jgi:hypothetical protein
LKALSPEELRAQRLEREQRALQDAKEARERDRSQSSLFLIIAGVLLVLAGAWFLFIAPSQGGLGGNDIINFHRLILGQTLTISGAVFFVGGLLLRHL